MLEKKKNPFADYSLDALPWVYIGWTGNIIKSLELDDESKLFQLCEAKSFLELRFKELTDFEL